MIGTEFAVSSLLRSFAYSSAMKSTTAFVSVGLHHKKLSALSSDTSSVHIVLESVLAVVYILLQEGRRENFRLAAVKETIILLVDRRRAITIIIVVIIISKIVTDSTKGKV